MYSLARVPLDLVLSLRSMVGPILGDLPPAKYRLYGIRPPCQRKGTYPVITRDTFNPIDLDPFGKA